VNITKPEKKLVKQLTAVVIKQSLNIRKYEFDATLLYNILHHTYSKKKKMLNLFIYEYSLVRTCNNCFLYYCMMRTTNGPRIQLLLNKISEQLRPPTPDGKTINLCLVHALTCFHRSKYSIVTCVSKRRYSSGCK